MAESPENFDLVVIGTGTAGSAPAVKCRAAGWSVAVIDDQPYGGTCALRGCDPKKVLVGAAELADWGRRMCNRNIVSGRPQVQWPELMSFKAGFTEAVPANRQRAFHKKGIAMFHGAARFLDRSRIEVAGKTLIAKYFVIASGAGPRALGVAGEDFLATSTDFLELQYLPKRIVFVGGGFISFEFAHVAARMGSATTILHRSARALRGFEPDLVDQLVEATEEIGVDVRLNSPLRAIEKRGDAFIVTADSEEGSVEIDADLVVHGAGRVPKITELDLPAGEIDADERGVQVDKHLQSVSNPAVYAAGDAASTEGPPLTPVAGMEGRIVAANLIDGRNQEVDYSGVSSVLFTIPPLARVGLSEAEARGKGLHFRVESGDTSDWYSSRRVAEETSGYKVLVELDTGRVLGAQLLGAHSEEVINLFALAVRHDIRASELKRMPYAYPTRASDIAYML